MNNNGYNNNDYNNGYSSNYNNDYNNGYNNNYGGSYNVPDSMNNDKNNNNIIIIILVIIIALLLIAAGVGTFFALTRNDNTRNRNSDNSRNYGLSVNQSDNVTQTTTAVSPEIVYVPVEVTQAETTPVVTTPPETVPVITAPAETVPVVTAPPNNANVSVDNSGNNVDMFPAFYSAFSTSQLSSITNYDGTFTYSASNVLDSNYSTCWAEGVSGSGINESIVLSSERKQHVSSIDIYNGLYTNSELFYKNNRIKDCRIEVSDGTSFDVTLDGDYYAQPNTVNFSYPVDTEYIKITILSVYGGNKYDDTCVTEILVR